MMRGKPLTLDMAMRICNNTGGIIYRFDGGKYAVGDSRFFGPVFATFNELQEALDAAAGDYFKAGQTLVEAWEARNGCK